MNDDYLDAFVRESEESITQLNNSLLALESDPDDQEAMDQVFRTAHTLKGNFGAMGFEDASALAHALEDLLDAIRQGDLDATPAVMDEIFEGVDRIESILDEIEEDGEPNTAVDDQVAALRTALEEGSDAGGGDDPADGDATDDAGDAGESPDADGPSEVGGADGPPEAGGADAGDETDGEDGVEVDGPPYRLRVELADSDMQGVDAMLALETAEDAVDVVETEPPREMVEEGSFDDGFVAVVDAAGPEAAAHALEAPRQVASATPAAAADASEAGAGPADASDGGDGDTVDPDGGDTVDPVDPDDGGATDPDGGDGGADAGSADDGDADGTISTDDIKSVRVDVDQLDDLYGLVEQLVTSRIKLRRAVEESGNGAATENLDELDKITDSLQDTVMDMRLVPVKRAVNTFPRMVRDLARDLDKQVDFRMEGTDVELDRTILDEISDPLMHVIRNAVDHGIEPPEVREEKGKPPTGTVRLQAERERDSVTITVRDDGAGLDVEEIREEAIEQGVRTRDEIETLDDSAVYDLVYHPGFSTSEEVTDVSGRGVGMDVVHRTVTRLDGDVSVDSEVDEGTTVTIELPVSMAIVKVLFVTVDGQEYGIPIKNIEEVSREVAVETIQGREVVSHGDDAYPIVDLDEALDTRVGDGAPRAAADGGRTEEMYVRVRESVRPVVLRCGGVTQQEEVVIKPFQGRLSDTPGLSGTAVIGDGNVVPIIDVTTL